MVKIKNQNAKPCEFAVENFDRNDDFVKSRIFTVCGRWARKSSPFFSPQSARRHRKPANMAMPSGLNRRETSLCR